MKTIYNSLITMSLAASVAIGQTTDNFSVIARNTKKTTNTSSTSTHYYAELSIEQLLSNDKITLGKSESENVKLAIAHSKTLQKQAEELSAKDLELRTAAKSKKGEEKKMLLEEAKDFAHLAEQKLIRCSEIIGKINRYNYTHNLSKYKVLCLSRKVAAKLAQKAENMYSDAEKDMRRGNEMREEAYAQPSNSTKLGTLENAEASETAALTKQSEAIAILQYAIVP
jgi:hypothetical protein